MHLADEHRYDKMKYNRCGRSGIDFPAISLGLWHNFGGVDLSENSRRNGKARIRLRDHTFRSRE